MLLIFVVLRTFRHDDALSFCCGCAQPRSDRNIKSLSLADSYKIVRFVGHGILNRAKVRT